MKTSWWFYLSLDFTTEWSSELIHLIGNVLVMRKEIDCRDISWRKTNQSINFTFHTVTPKIMKLSITMFFLYRNIRKIYMKDRGKPTLKKKKFLNYYFQFFKKKKNFFLSKNLLTINYTGLAKNREKKH